MDTEWMIKEEEEKQEPLRVLGFVATQPAVRDDKKKNSTESLSSVRDGHTISPRPNRVWGGYHRGWHYEF